MVIGGLRNIKKFYGDRLLLDIEDFKLYEDSRIGIVGRNGSGKTTLINILRGITEAEQGSSFLIEDYALIEQLEPAQEEASGEMNSLFGVNKLGKQGRSGGEETRLKLSAAFSKGSRLIIADEPTSNLDGEGTELLKKELRSYEGALLMVSHDRDFLDEVCTSILELTEGKIKLYRGNYSTYRALKEKEQERKLFEYESYHKEKQRLERAAAEVKAQSSSINGPPKRMGNSEARLHKKMGGQKGKAKLDSRAKSIEKRIEKLEVKERPKTAPKVKVDIQEGNYLYSKVIFSSKALNKRFGSRIIFDNASFTIQGGSKTAILGANGSGKTTLLNMLMAGDESVTKSKSCKIGYFNQRLSILDKHRTLLDNVLEESVHSETLVRTLLSRLLFSREDMKKKVQLLSGGEQVKASIAKILVGDYNLLMLDEPTNYLDIYSLEALEESLKEYEGTLIFVSHDRRFVQNVADHILFIEDKKLVDFQGGLKEYLQKKSSKSTERSLQEEKLLLENKRSEIIGRLSLSVNEEEKALLDKEFRVLTNRIRELS